MSLIQIYDRKALLEIGFSDIRKYHGELALMAVAVGFRVLQEALKELYPEQPPQRSAISILSGHAGPGFRDAFEYVTRVVTRGAYEVNIHYPRGQYDPYRPQSYAFVIRDQAGPSVEVTLQPDFLPQVFYDYLKQGRDNSLSPEDTRSFDQLKTDLAKQALQLPAEQLLEIRRVF
ncbi:hypothetical protein [Paenibacillus senegalensis]|uniref:hypothetical protein n=1 Tax=Paenibacillus senegalensis TaxID=1465766 RepID=UPI0002881B6A|nr:hypothetical protein [Paenibacillus senegalensis]